MQLKVLLLALAGLFTFVAVTSAAALDLPFPVVPAQFSGNLAGHDFALNGTVQSLFARKSRISSRSVNASLLLLLELQALHPDINPTNPNSAGYVDLNAPKNLTSRAAANKVSPTQLPMSRSTCLTSTFRMASSVALLLAGTGLGAIRTTSLMALRISTSSMLVST